MRCSSTNHHRDWTTPFVAPLPLESDHPVSPPVTITTCYPNSHHDNPVGDTLRQAWKGNCSSLPLMTILGKSNKWTSRGSNIPFLVTIICLGCSSTGSDLINAATSSAVFHLASYHDNSDVIRITWYTLTWPNLFCPAHTDVWMIFKNSWPVRGLNTKIAPLIGLVVRLPSNVY